MRTVGHGTLAVDDLLEVLREGEVATLVDVRRFPGSRRSPHLGRDEMARWLPAVGVAYTWAPELGGRRRPQAGSPHVALRSASFRAYADHMGTSEFATALDRLLDLDRRGPQAGQVAVLCAETLWWRCHRRLLSDALVLLHGVEVRHLVPGGRAADHVPTDGVRVEGRHLVYDAGAPPLDLV